MDALTAAKCELLSDRSKNMWEKLFEKNQKEDHQLHHLVPQTGITRNLRKERKYEPFRAKTVRFRHSPINYMLYELQDS